MDREEREVVGWERFCDELASLIHTSEIKIGHADRTFSLFIIERFQLACESIGTILDVIGGRNELSSFSQRVDSLLESVRRLITEWELRLDQLDVEREISGYRPAVIHTRRRGRPKFHISKEQLVFLRTLSFTWTRIASLLCVSRMTVYRRRRVYRMLLEGDSVPSDLELGSVLRRIRLDSPYIGQTLLLGRIRSMGYRVIRKRLREMVRAQDPLNTALQMPGGLTSRMKYSVAGPNSLWHIGKFMYGMGTLAWTQQLV